MKGPLVVNRLIVRLCCRQARTDCLIPVDVYVCVKHSLNGTANINANSQLWLSWRVAGKHRLCSQKHPKSYDSMASKLY